MPVKIHSSSGHTAIYEDPLASIRIHDEDLEVSIGINTQPTSGWNKQIDHIQKMQLSMNTLWFYIAFDDPPQPLFVDRDRTIPGKKIYKETGPRCRTRISTTEYQ